MNTKPNQDEKAIQNENDVSKLASMIPECDIGCFQPYPEEQEEIDAILDILMSDSE